jgi:hypothetical protein
MRELRVVYAGDDGVGKIMEDFVRQVIEENYALRYTATGSAVELLKTAQEGGADIFLMLLNSIPFSGGNDPAEERVDRVLKLVAHLKAKYGAGVIGLYSWPKHPYFPRRAKMAGVDFLFRVPFELKDFRPALEACLENVKRNRLE